MAFMELFGAVLKLSTVLHGFYAVLKQISKGRIGLTVCGIRALGALLIASAYVSLSKGDSGTKPCEPLNAEG